jgi:Fe-S cluster biogenesis protein NfuA/nitrite reductase/ring-hydroxylating ferredoxin subunit
MAGVRQVGVRQVGARVEELLGTLRSSSNEAVAPAAEELVRILLGLYGDGLGHIMAALHESGDAGAAVLDRLLADPLVESLLMLHDLHPLDVDTRIQRALDGVRPYLGSHAGGVEYLGVTDDGVAHLRLEGSCHGCPSSTVTVRLAIQGAIEEAAPEVTDVVVEGVSEPAGQQTLLQIGSGPPGPPGTVPGGVPGAGPGAPPPGLAGEPAWVTLPDIGPPNGRPLATVAGGLPVLLCSVRGTLYAYRDVCAACGSSLAQATLAGERLDCAGCGAAYDIRAAGRGLSDPTAHLDPLPLLADSQGVRVAVPEPREAVRS